MSSGSTLHFSPDFRVAMMAQTVELIKSGSRRKERASVRCKKPPRTETKSQHWHHRDKPAPTSDSLPTDSPCDSRAPLLKQTNIHSTAIYGTTTTLDSPPACYRDMQLKALKPQTHFPAQALGWTPAPKRCQMINNSTSHDVTLFQRHSCMFIYQNNS